MRTKRTGVSVRNLHINKLASLAKNNFLSKLFYILFTLAGTQMAYADKLSFEFIYGESVTSVNYVYSEEDDYAVDIDKYAPPFTVTPVASTGKYTIQVNTEITNSGSSNIASEFNLISNYLPNLNDSYLMELNGSEKGAAYLDFWIMGDLYINGDLVETRFTLAHNNHNNSIAPNDWWVSAPSYTSRYESGGLVAIDLHSIDSNGNNTGRNYCLIQNVSNSQVVVNSGMCNQNQINPDNWTNDKNEKLRFEYGSESIESMSFIYDGISGDIHNNENYLEGVTAGSYKNGYKVTVTSKLEADTETATSFINKFDPNHPESNMLQMDSKEGATALFTPDKLYFWVEGSLYINNQLVASDFTLGYDEHGKWWIGSISGNSTINNIPEMQLNGYCFIIKQGSGDAGSDDKWSVLVNSGTCPQINPDHGFSPPV